MTPSFRHLCFVVLALTGCGKVCPWGGCEDTDDSGDTDPPFEKVDVDPTVLRWNIAASDAPSDPQTVKFTNSGNVRLSLLNLDTIDNPVFRFTEEPDRLPSLAVGESLELQVVFDPANGGDFEGAFAPSYSGRGSPVRLPPIELIGQASGPTPGISAPAVGETVQWCSNTLTVELRNAGPDAMPINGVSLGPEDDCDAFHLDQSQIETLGDNPIPKDGLATLDVTFTPERPTPHVCELSVDTALARPVTAVLRGLGINTDEARETWYTSDGSGAHVLVLHDDGAPDVANHRQELADGLDDLVRALGTEGVDYRVAAPSSDSGCTVSSDRYATADDGLTVAVDVLSSNLFATGTTLADQPLRMMADALGPSSIPCFGAWLQAPDPVHAVVIAARDDDSRPSRSVTAWLDAIESEYRPLVVSVITPTSGCAAETPRLSQAARETGGRQFDLCADDWSSYWPAIGAATRDMRIAKQVHRLLGVPLSGSVRVAVDGIATENFRLDRRFDTSGEVPVELPPDLVLLSTPPDGTKVEVRYADVGTCR